MDALAYVTEPGYNALMLRRTFPELSGPDGLIAEARSWLAGTDAYATDGGRKWTFPNQSSLSFGHMEGPDDKFKYSSSQFSKIYFDELTTFTEDQYTFMFSRVRRPLRRSRVPLGVRSATNPIGRGLKWVKQRFIDEYDVDRNFIPALAVDNPHLDNTSYELSLSMLDPITRARLQHGRWDVHASGHFFNTDAIMYLDPYDLSYLTARENHPTIRVRAWDLAATEGGGDYTAGVLVAYDKASLRWRVEDVIRGQWGPETLEAKLAETARSDPEFTRYLIEQEPGSSGKIAARDIVRRVLAGFDATSRPSTGAKAERARLAAALLARGDMDVVRGHWNADFRDELIAFGPDPKSYDHDDQVDSLAAATREIARMMGTESTADTSAVDTFRRMSVVTSDAARSTGPPRQGIPGLHGPSSSPFRSGFRR